MTKAKKTIEKVRDGKPSVPSNEAPNDATPDTDTDTDAGDTKGKDKKPRGKK